MQKADRHIVFIQYLDNFQNIRWMPNTGLNFSTMTHGRQELCVRASVCVYHVSGPQTLVHTTISWRTCQNTDCWVLPIRFSNLVGLARDLRIEFSNDLIDSVSVNLETIF